MIIVELLGGLGNQMFQYAAGLSLAQRHNVPLRIDNSRFKSYKVWPYALGSFQVPQDMANANDLARLRVPSIFTRRILQRFWRFSGSRFYMEPHFYYDENFEKLGAETYLSGYFQSEKYFSTYAAELRNRFTPLEKQENEFTKLLRSAEVPVSLHIRRGDYISNSAAAAVHGLTNMAYYQRAVEIIARLVAPAIPTFFIFSDDQDWVRKNITFCSKVVYVEGQIDRPHNDISLMSMCHHHIIANSSFSWWGAWLNSRPDKTVIAPRQWFTPNGLISKNTRDLCPQGWILL